VELLASVRPRSVAVAFGFLVFVEATRCGTGGFIIPFVTLVLLLGPGGLSSVGNSCPSEEILNCLFTQNLAKLVFERHSNDKYILK
jgi:hypothetical protein